MVVLAILLMIAVVALTVAVFLAETDSAGFEVLEESFNVTGGGVFSAGLLTGLAIVGSGWMLLVGIRRSTIRRRELKELRTAHQRHQQEIEQERRTHEAEKADHASRSLVRPYVGSGGDRPPSEARPVEPGRAPRPMGPPSQPPPR